MKHKMRILISMIFIFFSTLSFAKTHKIVFGELRSLDLTIDLTELEPEVDWIEISYTQLTKKKRCLTQRQLIAIGSTGNLFYGCTKGKITIRTEKTIQISLQQSSHKLYGYPQKLFIQVESSKKLDSDYTIQISIIDGPEDIITLHSLLFWFLKYYSVVADRSNSKLLDQQMINLW